MLEPPVESTLLARLGLCSGLPIRKTPFTASKAAPVIPARALTVAAEPWE